VTKVTLVLTAILIGLTGCTTLKQGFGEPGNWKSQREILGEPGQLALENRKKSPQTWADIQKKQAEISPNYQNQEAEWDSKYLRKSTQIVVEVQE